MGDAVMGEDTTPGEKLQQGCRPAKSAVEPTWKTYRVSVGRYGSDLVAAKSRSQAIANTWRCDAFEGYSFKEFLKLKPRAHVVQDVPKNNDGYGYVRRSYGVDPTIGQRVRLKNEGDWTGREGVVVYPGPSTAHVHVAFDGLNHALSVHPSTVILLPSSERETSTSKVGVMPSDAHEGEVQPPKTESL